MDEPGAAATGGTCFVGDLYRDVGELGRTRGSAHVRLPRDGDKAPEALLLKVLSVNQQTSRSEIHDRPGQTATVETISLTISAQVEQVARSASGLKPGATITISYQITKRTPPLPGGRQAILLEPVQHVIAYLAGAAGSTYRIAAYGASFEKAADR